MHETRFKHVTQHWLQQGYCRFCTQCLLLDSQWEFQISLLVTMVLKFFSRDWILWVTQRASTLPTAFTDTAPTPPAPFCCVPRFSVYWGTTNSSDADCYPNVLPLTRLLNICYSMVDLSGILVSNIFILVLMSMKWIRIKSHHIHICK